MSRINIARAAAAALLPLMITAVYADITIEQTFSMEGGGFLSMLATDGEMKTVISGDKSRSDANLEMKSGMMQRMAGGGNSASIIRLDQDLSWQLLPDKRQYTEVTFAEMRAQMDQSMRQLEQAQQSGGGSLPVAGDECQWSPAQVSVEKPGLKQRFAGVRAEQHVVQVRQTCTVPKTGQSCEITFALESWLGKRMPNEKEAMEFQAAMAEKLGADELLAKMPASAYGMLGMFREGWSEAAAEFGELKGYPLKTVVEMAMGGQQCTTGSGQPIATDDVWSAAGQAGLNAAINSAAYHTGSAVGRKIAGSVGGSLGEQVAGSAAGAAAGTAVSGLFNKLKRKKKKKEPEPEPAAADNTGPTAAVIFRITQEITAISTDSVSQDIFELPEGWKKISR